MIKNVSRIFEKKIVLNTVKIFELFPPLYTAVQFKHDFQNKLNAKFQNDNDNVSKCHYISV